MPNKRGRLSPDERRRQIVDVAARHFAADGYERASMAAIAVQAGITRALVYHYFPSKEALFDAVLRREGEALLSSTTPRPDRSLQENVEAALVAYLAHFTASQGGLRDLYAPTEISPSVVREIAAANHEIQVGRLIEISGQAETPTFRLVLSAWLAFVETAARRSAVEPEVSSQHFVELCSAVFETATGLSLDLDQTSTSAHQHTSSHQQKDQS